MSHNHTRAARIKTSKRKPTRIPHPILSAHPAVPSSASLLLSFASHGTPSSSLPPYLVYPSSFSAVSLLLTTTPPSLPSSLPFSHPLPFTKPSNGNKNTKSRRASPITGSVSLVIALSSTPPRQTGNRLTYLPDPHRYAHDRIPNKLLLNRATVFCDIHFRRLFRETPMITYPPRFQPPTGLFLTRRHARFWPKSIVTYAN